MSRPPLVVHSGGAQIIGGTQPLGDSRRLPFELGGLLGRGGMGEVRSAHDPRLGRDVALKSVEPGDPIRAARLAREAALTARLEHPGIMPVYEAGRGEDGRPWYAMRLFTGQTLGEALAATASPAERLRLVRHVLDAALAVAYAHGQGIVHRDLKPANVLTGAFGETIVADWGLACAIDELKPGEPGVGTPGYMSPEQAAGGVVDARTDVYGLGAVLAEVLTGVPPGDDPRGEVRETRGIPAELVAIAERALMVKPDLRYPTASAFADDLLAWFEGRRVGAHEYSTAELLRRLVFRWRVPLGVAGIGLLAVGAAAGVGWNATKEERARAELSEAEAASARDDERLAFAAALRVQAGIAAAEGFVMEAEILAAQALRRYENAEARGVLAAVYGRPRWTRIATQRIRGCTGRALSPDGQRAVCISDEGLKVLDLSGGTSLGGLPGKWLRAVFAGDNEHLVVVSDDLRPFAWTLGREPIGIHSVGIRWMPPGRSFRPGEQAVKTGMNDTQVTVETGGVRETRACGFESAVQSTAIEPDGSLLASCDDQRVVRLGSTGETALVARVDDAFGVPTLAQPLGDGRLVVGTVTGHAMVFDAAGQLLVEERIGGEAIQIAEARNGRVVFGISGGEVVVWDIDANAVQARFRGLGLQVAWLGDEKLRFFGREVEDRAAPDEAWPHLSRVDGGVSALAFSSDGKWLAVGAGSGTTTVFDPASGHVRMRIPDNGGVVKDVAFSPDGQRLLVASASQQQRTYAVPSGEIVSKVQGFGARRAVWLPQAGQLLAPYSPYLWQVLDAAPETAHRLAHPGFGEMDASADGTLIAGISGSQEIWLGRDGLVPTGRHIVRQEWASAVAVSAEGVFVAAKDEVLQYDAAGELKWKAAIPRDPLDLAVSPGGKWLAVGSLDSSITVFAVGDPLPTARILGHDARVAALAFSPDGRWLASGDWDKEVRLWSVAAFEADANATAANVEGAWGRTLDEVLNPRVVIDGR